MRISDWSSDVCSSDLSNSESKSVEVLSGGNGTRSLTSASSSSSTTNACGDSSVIVSGKLAECESGVVPSLSSYATGNSGVTLAGTVEGGIYSSASGTDVSSASTQTASQTITSSVAPIGREHG